MSDQPALKTLLEWVTSRSSEQEEFINAFTEVAQVYVQIMLNYRECEILYRNFRER